MQVEEICARARKPEGEAEQWAVFPLLRSKLIQGIIGWLLGILVGGLVLAFLLSATIPYNYQHGLALIVLTSLFLAILLFIVIGSLYLLIIDTKRLIQWDRHIIVITRDTFVKQEGRQVVEVPLSEVRNVTARGRAPVDRTPPASSSESLHQVARPGTGMLSLFMGRNLAQQVTSSSHTAPRQLSKRTRTPTSLAFIDARTNKEVLVVNDNAYGDPFAIATILKEYVASAH